MGKEITSSLILTCFLLGEFVRYSEAQGTETLISTVLVLYVSFVDIPASVALSDPSV